MDRGLQKIFQEGFLNYSKTRNISVREYRAASSFMRCRTAELGGHIEYCPEGHVQRAHYNSCKHRSCPQCNAIQTERWLAVQKARLLDCPHHHIIFTVPHELIALWLFNRSEFMNIFFRAVRESMFQLLLDQRHLGATPGMLCAFHSWGRNLSIHPHIHCLCTDGGLSEERWIKPRRSHFLPAKVLMRVFRGTLSKRLHQSLEQGKLKAPTTDSRYQWHAIIKRVQRKKWNVRLQERYDYGEGVASYLARYVRGGPISNRQINIVEDGVSFRYYDHRLNPDGKRRIASKAQLHHGDFIQRYLQHVPDKGRQVVRSYGLYAHRKSTQLNTARALHHQAPVKELDFISWQSYMGGITGEDYGSCPTCQQRLYSQIIPRKQGPPQQHASKEAIH